MYVRCIETTGFVIPHDSGAPTDQAQNLCDIVKTLKPLSEPGSAALKSSLVTICKIKCFAKLAVQD